jgi:hypothetical protein
MDALILDPDPVLVAETTRLVGQTIPASAVDTRRLPTLWLAARPSGLPPLKVKLTSHMADSGLPIPPQLGAVDSTGLARIPLGLAVDWHHRNRQKSHV